MIVCGIDMVLVSRMAKALEKAGFAQRFFGDGERAELAERGHRPQSYAAAFAAKEAFAKALGTGVSGFALKEVELRHRENGAPYLSLSGAAADIVAAKGLELSVSITHDGDYAVAMVVGTRREDYR